MKTAKTTLSARAFLAALGFLTALSVPPAFAQTAAPSVSTPAPAVAVNSPAAPPSMAANASNVAPVPAMPTSVAATPAAIPLPGAAPDAGADKDKALNTMEDKVPEAAKQAMKNLDNPTAEVTLDDLNSARQAVAKIDALIEIEKRLAELDKIKSDRENSSMGGMGGMGVNRFAGAIPASALAPLPLPSASGAPPAMPVGFIDSNSIEVSRVMGSDGHYAALVKTPDGQTKTVHVGDKLSDGSSITAISATGVEFSGRDKHFVHVKDVNTVYGGTP